MEPRRFELRLPVPPLSEGLAWTGLALLTWVLENSEPEMKGALTALAEDVGGDAFRALWNDKAEELNRRVASRVLDARGVPADPNEGVIRSPGVN